MKTIPIPPPTVLVTSAVYAVGGRVPRKLHGNAGGVYRLERSTDLIRWLLVWTDTLTGTTWEWIEGADAPIPRFCRAGAP